MAARSIGQSGMRAVAAEGAAAAAPFAARLLTRSCILPASLDPIRQLHDILTAGHNPRGAQIFVHHARRVK
jgi:hypothetical protein